MLCVYIMSFIYYSHNELYSVVILFLDWIHVRMPVSNLLVGYFSPCIIPDMCEVDLDCGLVLRHLVDFLCHDSRPCVEVSIFDCFFVGVLYWAECRRM